MGEPCARLPHCFGYWVDDGDRLPGIYRSILSRPASLQKPNVLMFRYRLGQSPARSLQGLDALNLLRINHPHVAKALSMDCPVVQQLVWMLDRMTKLRRFLCRQGSVHKPLMSLTTGTAPFIDQHVKVPN